MRFPSPLVRAHLLRRYKRFLADVRLEDGSQLTVHCPNSGSMRGCSAPDSPALISRSDNPRRKYPWTLEMVRSGTTWVGVHTGRTNALVREALEGGLVTDLGPVEDIRAEVRVGDSRLDFQVRAGGRDWFIEVKNCSLAERGLAMFPDAPTARGRKHLRELMDLAAQGRGAAMFYCVAREDAQGFAPAWRIDPDYARLLLQAREAGVGILAWGCRLGPEEITLCRPLALRLDEEEG